MTVADLIERLRKVRQDAEIMILDGFNGGGEPREINLGPTTVVITRSNANAAADCEELVGQKVIILGYGCY
jgi:hypothetical protein